MHQLLPQSEVYQPFLMEALNRAAQLVLDQWENDDCVLAESTSSLNANRVDVEC